MGIFSRITRESGDKPDAATSAAPSTNGAGPKSRESSTAPAPEPRPAPKPEEPESVKPEEPESVKPEEPKSVKPEEPKAVKPEEPKPEQKLEESMPEKPEEPEAEERPEPISSAPVPPDLIPPDAAPVPRRVEPDEDAEGEVRLTAADIIAPTPKRPHPFAPTGSAEIEERRARVISFANQKGGVAKTTTTLNLAVALAEMGHKVLAIDLDPQGNLTMSQGIDPEGVDESMYNVLVEQLPITKVIADCEIDLAVASIDLAGAEIAMSTQIGRERALQKALAEVGDDYDYVCIDTPPSLGLLTINAMTASNSVIVPVQCEYLSMRGLAQLQNTLEMIRDNLNPAITIEGILPTMMDSRTVHAKEAVDILEENFGDLVFKTRIKKAVKFAEAPVRGSSVLKYDPEGKASQYYRDLAQEVLAGVKA